MDNSELDTGHTYNAQEELEIRQETHAPNGKSSKAKQWEIQLTRDVSSSSLELHLLICLESAALILVCQAVPAICLSKKQAGGRGGQVICPSIKGSSN